MRGKVRRRRTVLIGVGAVAAVAIAGGIAIGISASARPGSPAIYSVLPPACSVVSATTLAKYVPSGSGAAPGHPISLSGRTSACSWLGVGSDGKTRVLGVQIVREAGISQAREAFGSSRRSAIRSVPGVGDEAMLVRLPGSSAAVSPNLFIRSANVLITISYALAPAGAGQAPVNFPDTGAMTAVGHDVVAALTKAR